MTIREKLKRKEDTRSNKSSAPSWVTNGNETTASLYQAVESEFGRISELIKGRQVRGLKDRKLVLAKIAKLAGKDRSIVTTRRQPEVCLWIDRRNRELDELLSMHPLKAAQARSKRELQRELAALRKAEQLGSDALRRAIVERFFTSNLLEDRDKLARDVLRFRNENQSLMDKLAKLEQSNVFLTNENAQLHNVLTNSQRAELHGIRLVKDK